MGEVKESMGAALREHPVDVMFGIGGERDGGGNSSVPQGGRQAGFLTTVPL